MGRPAPDWNALMAPGAAYRQVETRRSTAPSGYPGPPGLTTMPLPKPLPELGGGVGVGASPPCPMRTAVSAGRAVREPPLQATLHPQSLAEFKFSSNRWTTEKRKAAIFVETSECVAKRTDRSSGARESAVVAASRAVMPDGGAKSATANVARPTTDTSVALARTK